MVDRRWVRLLGRYETRIQPGIELAFSRRLNLRSAAHRACSAPCPAPLDRSAFRATPCCRTHDHDAVHTWLGILKQPEALLECRATLLEVVMPVVRTLDEAELVAEASFGYFAANTERGQVRARCPAQVVQRELQPTVRHSLPSHVECVDADVRYPLARIPATLREDVFAAARVHVSAGSEGSNFPS